MTAPTDDVHHSDPRDLEPRYRRAVARGQALLSPAEAGAGPREQLAAVPGRAVRLAIKVQLLEQVTWLADGHDVPLPESIVLEAVDRMEDGAAEVLALVRLALTGLWPGDEDELRAWETEGLRVAAGLTPPSPAQPSVADAVDISLEAAVGVADAATAALLLPETAAQGMSAGCATAVGHALVAFAAAEAARRLLP